MKKLKLVTTFLLLFLFLFSCAVNSELGLNEEAAGDKNENENVMQGAISEENLELDSQSKASRTESESNNTRSKANRFWDDYNVYGKISSRSDVDYFKITFKKSGKANFYLGKIPSGRNYDLYLYNRNGSKLRSSTNSRNKSELISYKVTKNRTYYIKVKSRSGYSSKEYLLRAKVYEGKTYLKLTKTSRKDEYGLYKLKLSYYEEGSRVGYIYVCSGQSRAQKFRKGKDSKSGSMEPLPEGKWEVTTDIRWYDGKNNYDGKVFPDRNNGFGPAKTSLEYVPRNGTDRSAILFHIDWNRTTKPGTNDGNKRYPGTAGCIGFYDIDDHKKFVRWFKNRSRGPKGLYLYVDWDLGSCPNP